MDSDKKILSQIIKTIKNNKKFFIAGHAKPDGDTVGSSLALASLLRRLGKRVDIYSKDIIPDSFLFLYGVNKIKISDKVKLKYDCAILLECSSFDRMGGLIDKTQADIIINIDHHAVYSNYGNINYVNSKASSSAEQIFNLFNQIKMPINSVEAESLYTGLVTDTGKFQHSNTTPFAMKMAATLIDAGVKTSKLYEHIFATQSLESIKLLGASLSTIQILESGKIAYIEITNLMYNNTNSKPKDTEGIINYLMRIPGVIVAILFRETETPNTIKVSLRSRGNFDVNKIAGYFNGGGHKNASGCTINEGLKKAEIKILKCLQKEMKAIYD